MTGPYENNPSGNPQKSNDNNPREEGAYDKAKDDGSKSSNREQTGSLNNQS